MPKVYISRKIVVFTFHIIHLLLASHVNWRANSALGMDLPTYNLISDANAAGNDYPGCPTL